MDKHTEKNELISGKLSKNLEKQMAGTLIRDAVLYASGTWTIRKQGIRDWRLSRF